MNIPCYYAIIRFTSIQSNYFKLIGKFIPKRFNQKYCKSIHFLRIFDSFHRFDLGTHRARKTQDQGHTGIGAKDKGHIIGPVKSKTRGTHDQGHKEPVTHTTRIHMRRDTIDQGHKGLGTQRTETHRTRDTQE